MLTKATPPRALKAELTAHIQATALPNRWRRQFIASDTGKPVATDARNVIAAQIAIRAGCSRPKKLFVRQGIPAQRASIRMPRPKASKMKVRPSTLRYWDK